MKEGWAYKPLGEITTSINGLWKGKKPPFVNVGVIRNANFTKDFTLNYDNIVYLDVEERQYASRKLERGDLIVEKSGGSEKQPVGRTILFDSDGDFSVSNFTSILRIKDKKAILPEFLYKYILYMYKEGVTRSMQNATTGIHNIIYEQFLSIPIPVLTVTEQERIVSYLDAEFAKIDALKANIEQQLQASKDLFQSALKEMLTPKEGWERIKLTKVCESITAGGDAPKGRVRDEKDENFCYPIYSNGVENEGLYGYTDDYKYNKPAITVAARGTIGAAFIRYVPFTPIVRLITLIPDSDKADIGFMYYIIKSLNIGHTGSSIPQLTVPMIKEMEFSFPSLPEQERIAARLDTISEKVKALQANYDQTINLCNDLKQSLLKSIFE